MTQTYPAIRYILKMTNYGSPTVPETNVVKPNTNNNSSLPHKENGNILLKQEEILNEKIINESKPIENGKNPVENKSI